MVVETIYLDTDVEDGKLVQIQGRSLESLLERRIVWKQTVLTGSLQDGIHQLLDENIISPTDSDRKIENFIFEESTDEAITSLTINAQYTGDNLFEVIVNICETNGIGFKITLNESNQFVFKLYSGKDRTYNQSVNPYVIFSPKFDNIINSSYMESDKTMKNVTLVAGEGEGVERKTTSVGSATGLSRREMYTDARDISSQVDNPDSDYEEIETLSDEEYTALLVQRGTNALAEWTSVKSFEGKVDATRMFIYGEDFFIGDIVQIADEYGIEGTARITELIRSQDKNGMEVYPTFDMME